MITTPSGAVILAPFQLLPGDQSPSPTYFSVVLGIHLRDLSFSLLCGFSTYFVATTALFSIDFATYFDGFLSSFSPLRQPIVVSLHSILHRGHSPLSYSHAAVLHPEFGFGFAFGL